MFHENTKKRSWLDIVMTVIIFILIIAIVGTFVLFGIFKDTNSAPSLFGYRVYIMNGDGMEPRIAQGSAVFVKEGQFPEREGNVILCSIDGQLAVVGFLGTEEMIDPNGTSETRYIVKYDTAPSEEKWGVGQDDIIGVAKTYSTFFGGLVRFASSKAGMLTMVIIPCALVLAYEVTMFVISLKKKKKENKTPIIDEPVNVDAIRAEIEKAKKKKFELEEGYLDKIPEEEPKPAKEINIRQAEPARPEQKLEFTSDKKPEQKLEFTSDKPAAEPVAEAVAEAPKTEAPKPASTGLNIENLSPSRIDDLIAMLEAEKARLESENKN